MFSTSLLLQYSSYITTIRYKWIFYVKFTVDDPWKSILVTFLKSKTLCSFSLEFVQHLIKCIFLKSLQQVREFYY